MRPHFSHFLHPTPFPHPQVSGLSVGDWVVPLEPAVGTWRREGTFPAASFHRIPSNIPPEAAAMLCIK